jgi:hypothetical protein
MTASIHARILDAIAARMVDVPAAATTSTDAARVFSLADGVVIQVAESATTTSPSTTDTCRDRHTLDVAIVVIAPRLQQPGTTEPIPSWRRLDPFRVEIHNRMMGTPVARRVDGLALDTIKGQDQADETAQDCRLIIGYTVTYQTLSADLTQ